MFSFCFIIRWSKQLKDLLVLLLFSFMYNFSINEHKKVKLTLSSPNYEKPRKIVKFYDFWLMKCYSKSSARKKKCVQPFLFKFSLASCFLHASYSLLITSLKQKSITLFSAFLYLFYFLKTISMF